MDSELHFLADADFSALFTQFVVAPYAFPWPDNCPVVSQAVSMMFPRASGILLHPTSLPGPFGIGDFGPAAYRFVDFLSNAGQRLWEILPLGLPGKGNSPYQCVSAFAGNPLLISPEKLVEHGYLRPSELARIPSLPPCRVDFERVIPFKEALLRKAFTHFSECSAYCDFAADNSEWLEEFARFMACRAANGSSHWINWDAAKRPDEAEIRFQKFCQFEFFRQWSELKDYCQSKGVSVIGDLPFYVHHDSADVCFHPELFDLDTTCWPRTVGGVPPDYFSADGQLWGFPTYRWDTCEESGFRWWLLRLQKAFEEFALVRLDHFRGFEACWQVPAGEATARNGTWVQGPGAKVFEAARRKFGALPIIAENLGVITPEVEDLRRQFSFPGMAVLQFAFGSDSGFRPHTYPKEVVAFTGTHDNDTVRGWWAARCSSLECAAQNDLADEYFRASSYLGCANGDIHWAFIRAVMTSVADIAVIPLQDVLGLDGNARMNVPGCESGNWRWRFQSADVTPEITEKLARLTRLCDR